MLLPSSSRLGAAPRALEMCSAVEAFVGFQEAGSELTHVEIDAEAAASYALTFGSERGNGSPWVSP